MTRAIPAAALAAAALVLSACVSLLPEAEPVQLYRFGLSPAEASQPAAAETGVRMRLGDFPAGAGGDRILTITGGSEAAYIEGVRWVAPASILFGEAATTAFDASSGPMRLLTRGQTASQVYGLRLDVRTFETRYAARNAAPTVAVRVHAVLTRPDNTTVAQRSFEHLARAGDNRVSAIVRAYDAAVAEVMGDVVDWANASASASPLS